ncbi:A/G-specific adenine glycosylase [Faecalicatena contorta]|uniref:A/G-specific adenine glycosylase n=1 Tax=Faecalicatena contorta TaxID=39482 RepID=UPI001F339DB4|nr:A/G-specific adenine glycosylase [Faecalicatena contorta]MCF2681837.1 A/G-specific adenine glycosylase [Faecalicatena contorta]
MKYENIQKGTFIARPNRFIAYAEIDGDTETVHVKNTGRCAELLVPGATVYLQKAFDPKRKTKWDLIAVDKVVKHVSGDCEEDVVKLVNMDSQVPNKAVKEWLEEGNLIEGITRIRPEYTYGNSRIDLYVEAGEKKVLIEVKGVTLEENGRVRFPDAPSERAVKHVEELTRAVREGYEAYVFFVIQMRDVRYFTPNMDTHPAFCEALQNAAREGVHVVAYDCAVSQQEIHIAQRVPVILENPALYELADPIVRWYTGHKRDLPWRKNPDAYRVWVSEIMLQQTRVEAVKPYYERFLQELPTVKDLAEAREDTLLKLWEGLGYYNRVRNMQAAAKQIMTDFKGRFPDTYEEILSLKGIGRYTAGAISAFAYGLPKPAVDGNVLRVISRITGSREDIMKQSVRTRMEEALEAVIPAHAAGDFDQGLIELGAIVCVPNGSPKCEECPVAYLCEARKAGVISEIPVKSKGKARKIEKRTVLLFKDGQKLAIQKRPPKGLLAGLYEFPNLEGWMSQDEVTAYCKEIGLMPVRIKKLENAKHVFSHIEWHMKGYEVVVDELEKTNRKGFLFIRPEEIEREYSIPSAFEKYVSHAGIKRSI